MKFKISDLKKNKGKLEIIKSIESVELTKKEAMEVASLLVELEVENKIDSSDNK